MVVSDEPTHSVRGRASPHYESAFWPVLRDQVLALREDELGAWENRAELEVAELPHAGRVVLPAA